MATSSWPAPTSSRSAIADRSASIAVDTGRPLWQRDISSYGGAAAGENALVLADADGNVWGIRPRHGREPVEAGSAQVPLAEHARPCRASTWSLATAKGFVHWLSLDEGKFAARERLSKKPIESAPIVVGDTVYVEGRQGTDRRVQRALSFSPLPQAAEAARNAGEGNRGLRFNTTSTFLSVGPHPSPHPRAGEGDHPSRFGRSSTAFVAANGDQVIWNHHASRRSLSSGARTSANRRCSMCSRARAMHSLPICPASRAIATTGSAARIRASPSSSSIPAGWSTTPRASPRRTAAQVHIAIAEADAILLGRRCARGLAAHRSQHRRSPASRGENR